MVDIWSHSIIIAGKRAAQLESRFVEIRFFETVWKRAHRSIGATCDSIVSNRWTRFEHLDCVDGLSNPVDHNAAAAVSYVGIIDILKENPFVLTIAPDGHYLIDLEVLLGREERVSGGVEVLIGLEHGLGV